MVAGTRTFAQRITEEVHAGKEPADVARELASVASRTDVEELIEDRARIVRRASVRELEDNAFRERFRDIAAGAPLTVAPSATLRELFHERFSIGSGEMVTWGQATISQHAQRIDLLSKIRSGIDETIARHREAIRMIEANGVSALEDIA